jgi:hypothetical protein
MTENNKQTQKVGDQAVAIAGGRDVNVTVGVTAAEVTAIVTEVFAKSFLSLRSQAAEAAAERAAEILAKFIAALEKENPDGLKQANSVDFQVAVYNAQRDYARSGDEQLGDVLVDLLVERSKVPDRSLLQLTLTQALETVRLLTQNQISALALIYSLRYTANSEIANIDELLNYFDSSIWTQVESLSLSDASLMHLNAASCGNLSVAHATIPYLLLQSYYGLFQKGIFREAVELQSHTEAFASLLAPCFHDSSKLQVAAISDIHLGELIRQRALNPAEATAMRQLWRANTMSEGEVENFLRGSRSYMSDLISLWNRSRMKNFELSSVGLAIGHAALRRKGLTQASLEIWIPPEHPTSFSA